MKRSLCNKCHKKSIGLIGICYQCDKKEYNKQYYKINKKKFVDGSKKRYYDNKEECLNNMKKYYEKNKKQIREYYKEYLKKNYDKLRKNGKIYYEENKSWMNPKNRQRTIERKKTDVNCMLRDLLRSRIAGAIKHQKSNKKTLSTVLLGTDINTVREHLEKQFKDNMNWTNYGTYGWHIDHIIPCISFNLVDIEEQKKCFHYTNLQPLWAKENLRKGGKIK